MKVPTIDDVLAAARQLDGNAVKTPLLSSEVLNALTGAQVYLKPECLQRTGSFKFRGAYNAISRLTDEERARGIIASSSGNHAQGVAEAASIFRASATIVMPSDAPQLKVDRTRRSGAEVVFYDRASEDREAVVAEVIKTGNMIFVHPYENHDVIAGQGTVGLEIVQDMQKQNKKPDRVLVCCGGGGLTSGVALAVCHHFPDAKIHSVEPEGFDDYKRSLESGSIVANATQSGSICDAILAPSPGQVSFAINKDILSEGLVISDDDVRAAVRFAYEELKIVVEPGGAAALAALLNAQQKWAGETVAVVISGGNVDPSVFASIISG